MKKGDLTCLAIIVILLVFQLYFYLSPVWVAKFFYNLFICRVKALPFVFLIISDVTQTLWDQIQSQ